MGKKLAKAWSWSMSPFFAGTSALINIAQGDDPIKGIEKDVNNLADNFYFKPPPDIDIQNPAAPVPVRPVEKAGIKSGSADRLKRRRTLGSAYLTKGQQRGASTALGGIFPTLG